MQDADPTELEHSVERLADRCAAGPSLDHFLRAATE